MKHVYTLLFLLFFSKTYAISPQVIKTPHRAVLGQETAIAYQSTSSINAYIREQAVKVGINPDIASWIVGHESQYGQNMRGDDGQSRGTWMISSVYHPEVSNACADDLKCSTAWSLNWIKEGHINQWSTWRLKYKLYPTETPPSNIFLN